MFLCFQEFLYFPVKYCKESAVGELVQALECCCFDRGAKIILREFSDRNDFELENYLYDIYSLVASFIKTLEFHCIWYLIQN